MRIFLAVDISDELREELALIQKKLSDKLSNTKWVIPENLHITLKFIGEVEPEEAENVAMHLEQPIKKTPSFYIELGELGVFPNIKRPRVFWAGLKKGRRELIHLNGLVEKKLFSAGSEKSSKPFSPHITMARFRHPPSSKEVENAMEYASLIKNKGHLVQGISIYESILKPKGPEYKLLYFLSTNNS